MNIFFPYNLIQQRAKGYRACPFFYAHGCQRKFADYVCRHPAQGEQESGEPPSARSHGCQRNFADYVCSGPAHSKSERMEVTILIEVSHLTKRYGKNSAIEDLSFSVEDGQIYGFLGPNGAGKSTTMNILTGYIAPTAGEALINGHNVIEEPEEARKCIGYLPEIPPVYPEMTVMEYLRFAADLKKIPKEKRAGMISDVMEETGLTDMQGRLIRNLSKGYRQRTGLAQAILGYPDVIILDEPMVGLDPKQIIEIRELIRGLGKEHTVILSSHILSEISAICDHIMIISHGRLVASDTPDNLLHMMKGSGSLELTVQTNRETAYEMFSSLPEVHSLDIKKSAEPHSCDIVIQSDSDNDLRERIFYLCAQRKTAILRMQQSHVSLEDVFLELTEGEAPEEKAALEKADSAESEAEDSEATDSKAAETEKPAAEEEQEGGASDDRDL